MAGTREKLIHAKRIENLIPLMPFYVIEYIEAKKRARYSSSTLLGYLHEYVKFFSWLISEGISSAATIKNISLEDLQTLSKKSVEFYQEFLENEIINASELETNPNLEPKTRSEDAVNRNINALKSLFNYLTQETEDDETGECYFYRNVFNKIKIHKKEESASRRAKKINSIILNDEEIEDFLNFIKFDYEKILTLQGKKKQQAPFLRDKERDIALISMMLGTGVRVSEIAGLTLKEINFQQNEIDITRKGNKADTVDVLTSSLDDLKAYLRIREIKYPGAASTPYVFVTRYKGTAQPISVRAIQNLVSKYSEAFFAQDEFSTGKVISPHKLRHTFAGDFIKKGGNIILLRDQLGHNSIETTQKYTNLSKKERKAVMEAIESSRNG
ncbi:tyrosine recombinase XerS [Bacillus sp. MUM 13]|uniref:tyrosine recombinase XerS n=1 Tax=Bacillus sp. MUM 13 TaxID=1678001 RepID=UPI0008F5A9D6|nr:tyrosine recombinase XerS [Bacillus sp. MUM 13]OIK04300.1 tyrosine recombinase XerS [Bacillus sp. MUM 13]